MSLSGLILAQPVALGWGTFQNYTLALEPAPLRADFTSHPKLAWIPPLNSSGSRPLAGVGIPPTSEGDNWNGQQLTKVKDRFSRLRAALQRQASKSTRSCRRRCRQLLQRLSGRERGFQAWVNHNISKSIVKTAQSLSARIAIEDLSGIREGTNQHPRSREERRRWHSWGFYQLRRFIEYKAVGAGSLRGIFLNHLLRLFCAGRLVIAAGVVHLLFETPQRFAKGAAQLR